MITFKNPYLGNTCVPFQHWACSEACAKELEVPARLEQIAKARELDTKYKNYIRECQRSFVQCKQKRSMLTCFSPTEESDIVSSCNTSIASVETSVSYSTSCNSSDTDTASTFDVTPVQSKKCVIM